MDYLPYLGFVLALVCIVVLIKKLPELMELFEKPDAQHFQYYNRLDTRDIKPPRKRFDGDPARHRLVRKFESRPFDDAA